MLRHSSFVLSAVSLLMLSACATAAPTEAEAPAAAAEDPLEAIEPVAEAVSIALAGEVPADISRYLLASGAQGASLSPDGSTIAMRYSITGVPQIWTMPATGGQPSQLTFGNGITFFSWTPDGSSLVYGADNDGNEQESYYRIAADGLSESVLMPAVEGGFRAFGGFSADGSTLAFSSTERNGLDFDIYAADTADGQPRLVYEGIYGFFVRGVSPSGDKLLVNETVGEDSDNIYFIDTATGERTTISAPDPRANHTDAGVRWTRDGSTIFLATNESRDFAALMALDVASGEMNLVAEADMDVDAVALCGAGDRYLLWTTNEDGFNTLHAMDRETGASVVVPTLPEGTYRVSCSAASSRVAISLNAWNTPGDILLWDISGGTVNTIFESNLAGLPKARLVKPESIRMAARDGVELQGLLYLPHESARTGDGPPPVVFDVHGGPTGQSRPTYDATVQYLVDRGIAVFQPNVRGSTGFGRVYVTLDDREKRLDSVRDLIDMLDALEQDGRVDTSRAAVIGGSYGGYMVNAVLANYPGRFKAGAALFGVADWITALEVASPALKASDLIEYGDISDPEWRAFYEANSPIRQADQITVPVLYSHGVMDPRIDIYETEVMVRALRANGIEAPFIRIPDEGHGWRKLSNQMFYFRRQAEFLEAQLAAD